MARGEPIFQLRGEGSQLGGVLKAQRVLDGEKQELRKKEAVSAWQERKIAEERARLKKEEENLALEANKVGSEKAAVASRRKVRRTYPASSICFPIAAGVSILLK